MHRDTTRGGARDRGQTAQDFAVGIGLFLLAVAFVFAFVPQIVSPYDVGIGASEASQADRAADSIVHNLSVDGEQVVLDASAADHYFIDTSPTVEDLRERTGLPFSARINVTIRNVESESVVGGWQAGPLHREGREAATASRIVRTDDGTCEPACRLVVRVW